MNRLQRCGENKGNTTKHTIKNFKGREDEGKHQRIENGTHQFPPKAKWSCRANGDVDIQQHHFVVVYGDMINYADQI